MSTAMGVLGWTPAVFWAATPDELAAAVEGFNRANGAGDAMTGEELKDLMRDHPDG
jgi:uncharacterized phage protein (TIGR02216 family)